MGTWRRKKSSKKPPHRNGIINRLQTKELLDNVDSLSRSEEVRKNHKEMERQISAINLSTEQWRRLNESPEEDISVKVGICSNPKFFTDNDFECICNDVSNCNRKE